MDGGARQEEMAESLKRKVKERGHRRIGNPIQVPSRPRDQRLPSLSTALDALDATTSPDAALWTTFTSTSTAVPEVAALSSGPLEAGSPQPGSKQCLFAASNLHRRNSSVSGQFDETVLVMFYIEHVMPFLFPFYHPPLLRGGRAWILDMINNSPVVRRAVLCQSSYFISVSRGAANDDGSLWTTVLTQTREAFEVLRQALAVITGSNILDHLHGAVRVLSGIMQVQRLDIAISGFGNCRFHLNAALVLFQQLLDTVASLDQIWSKSSFEAVMYRLSPPSWSYALNGQLPSAEQAAFQFSSALLIFDDIVASTVLQEQPRLYAVHQSLLGDVHGTGPVIDLEDVIGCQNWALLQVAEISRLDAWKQQCKNNATLDVMELVRRATPIKAVLESHLGRLDPSAAAFSDERSGFPDLFATNNITASQKPLITTAWAHAALIYLSVVVSGWQPANPEIIVHVRQIIEVVVRDLTPPALLRTIVWPLTVAGCLASPELAGQLSNKMESLQPRGVFGTITKTLEIMRGVWYNSHTEDLASRDLASCLRNTDDLVLLV